MSAIDARDPQTPSGEIQEDMSHAAVADATLEPGRIPGGPEYPDDAVEGEGTSVPLAEDERGG